MSELAGSLARHWLPGPRLAAVLVPAGLLAAALAGWGAGRLRTRRGWPAAYTRKVFHFLVFTLAGAAHLAWGRPGAVAFGSAVAACVAWAAWRGRGQPFYEALARPADEPRRTLFVLVPLATTALGGVLANLWFPRHAVVGYLVCGWGDAVAEPVGARWGRRTYRVPSLAGVDAERSLEGSASVLVVGTAAAAVGLAAGGAAPAVALTRGGLCALAATVVEAASTHGADNLTVQLAAAGAAALLA